MLKRLQTLSETWNIRAIAVAMIVAAVVLSEIMVIVIELLLHHSLGVEALLCTFFVSFGVSMLLSLISMTFLNRLRQAEIALRKSEAENRAILQALPDILFWLSADGRFLQHHTAYPELLWRSPAEFIGKSLYEVFPPEFADQAMHYIAAALQTQEIQRYEYELPYEGMGRYFEARMVKYNGNSVLVIIRDITTQKMTEMALQAERESLAQRVEERTAALQAANAQLLHALQAQDEFVNNINHELRTPLTPILAFSDLLLKEHYGPLNKGQRQIVTHIKESAKHLSDLLNDVLDFSDFKSGQLKLKIEPVNVEETCRASLRHIEAEARRKGLTVKTAFDDTVSTIPADAKRLRKILDNLLGNAVRFTHKGGTIGLEVKGDEAAHLVHFIVWDTGIGIPETSLALLFQPFTQIESTGESKGLGLGLALVQCLAEMHGGYVNVESQVGQGSRFTVSLPWHVLPSETPSPAPVESADTGRPKDETLILVAEDDSMNLKVLCHMLNMAGYRTITAADGAEAIEITRTHRPDLILMDIRMPVINGIEAMRIIRNDATLSSIPIIVVTALTASEDREQCIEAGATAFVGKPMDMKQLLQIIEGILSHPAPPAPDSTP
ncbi:MAG TPA: response regulator [Anaerolineae bacterium]|nr:response regulator [Anaerolineae bacterium]HQK12532.1 response regulator [Anaerolineae bacterium]